MSAFFCSLGFISNGVIYIITLLLDLIPDFDLPIFEVPRDLLQILSYAWYFLPMGTISTLFMLSIFITGIRYTWSIVLRIKSFIPFLGG